jgi:hypothetical protein
VSAEREFDLTDQVEDVKRVRSGWRAFGALFVFVGAAMAALGAYLCVIHSGTSSSTYEATAGIFAAVGAVVAVASWGLATEARTYPTRIAISEQSITLQGRAGTPLRYQLWNDPGIKLGLIDRRGLPPTRPDGTPRIKFSLQTRRGPWIPIPMEAFYEIVRRSEANGLSLSRRIVQPSGALGSYEIISIRANQS